MGDLLFFNFLCGAFLGVAYISLSVYRNVVDVARLKQQKRASKIQREIDSEISSSGKVKIRGFDGIESYNARKAEYEIKLITLTDVEIERL